MKNLSIFLFLIGLNALGLNVSHAQVARRLQAEQAFQLQLLLFNRLPLHFQAHALGLNKDSASFSAEGGSGSVKVIASGFGSIFPWTVKNTNNWITITSGKTGVGSGTVKFSVAYNYFSSSSFLTIWPPRKGTLTIAGQTFVISQAELFIQPEQLPPIGPPGF